MHIKAKLYPYPVLAGYNDDYVNRKFNINGIIQATSTELVIKGYNMGALMPMISSSWYYRA